MLTLTVNGVERLIDDVEPSTPLLWVLRDNLNLVGAKYGCGIGQCGACTVWIDGEPVRSCSFSAVAAAEHAVTTIEGLSRADGPLHPLQQAWIDLDVPQCGYCQAGQIMSAAALLKRKPIQPMPISMRRWPAICAVAPPICAFARRFMPPQRSRAPRGMRDEVIAAVVPHDTFLADFARRRTKRRRRRLRSGSSGAAGSCN